MGLPEHDDVYRILTETEDLQGHQASIPILDEETATFWSCGKQLAREQKLGEFLKTKNEKTKVIAKLQKRGQGPPAREPPVDEKTQREMMAFWYKKQEEQKQLADDDDDAFVNSAWANPKGMKNHFQGSEFLHISIFTQFTFHRFISILSLSLSLQSHKSRGNQCKKTTTKHS